MFVLREGEVGASELHTVRKESQEGGAVGLFFGLNPWGKAALDPTNVLFVNGVVGGCLQVLSVRWAHRTGNRVGIT